MIHPDCSHLCSGNCRRVGCNCECGEWHDKYEPVTEETIAEIGGWLQGEALDKDIDAYFEKVTIKEGANCKPVYERQ